MLFFIDQKADPLIRGSGGNKHRGSTVEHPENLPLEDLIADPGFVLIFTIPTHRREEARCDSAESQEHSEQSLNDVVMKPAHWFETKG